MLCNFISVNVLLSKPQKSNFYSEFRNGRNWNAKEEETRKWSRHKTQILRNNFFMLIQFKCTFWWCTMSGLKASLSHVAPLKRQKYWIKALVFTHSFIRRARTYNLTFENVKTVELVECKERIFHDTICFIYLFQPLLNEIQSKAQLKKEKKFWIFFFFPKAISSEEKVNGGNRQSFEIFYFSS